VEIDGMLYILGGEDGSKELTSMERYDIYSKTWTKQPDLTMVRKVRTVAFNNWSVCVQSGL
jgi:kelch-like protein 16 (gigaxonin)